MKLARKGIGSVEPNPTVGCVIVKQNQVIGSGWHKNFGGPHAEINAIEDCKTLGATPAGATMYVTLEPCCHQGKTPPCTNAIIAAGLARVVAAAIDPSEHAAGKGIEQLRRAGIQVQTGVCETQAKLLNAPFIKFVKTGRCWVILKWAQTIDGKMAWADKANGRWISNQQSRKDVQNLRRRAGGILAGINTVIADDPLLTVRPASDKKPVRIVLDNQLRIPPDCKLLTGAKESPVLIVACQSAVQANPQKQEEITTRGAEIIAYPDTGGRSNLHFLLDELKKRGITQLLVEGGAKVIKSFLKEDLADEICIYIAPKILGAQGSANISELMAELERSIDLQYVDIKNLDGDVRLSGLSKKTLAELSIPED